MFTGVLHVCLGNFCREKGVLVLYLVIVPRSLDIKAGGTILLAPAAFAFSLDVIVRSKDRSKAF